MEIKAPRPASVSQTVRIYAEYDFPEARSSLFSEFSTATLWEKNFVLKNWSEEKKKDESQKNGVKIFFCLFLPFLPHSPLMSLCALNQLGLCGNLAAQYRYATQDWCKVAQLSEEDMSKVQGKPLCSNHSREPTRINSPTTPSPPAKKLRSDTPTSPTSPTIAKSPLSGPQMEEAGPQTAGKIVTKPCLGTNNEALEKFIEHRFGKIIPDDEGYLWGYKQRGWTTFKSVLCTGEARSAAALRCAECNSLFHAMSKAKTRQSTTEGAHKFIPTSSLRVSPYVKELLEKFKKDQKDTKVPEIPNVDDLEIEVSPCPLNFEILKYCAHFFYPPEPRRQRLSCECVPQGSGGEPQHQEHLLWRIDEATTALCHKCNKKFIFIPF